MKYIAVFSLLVLSFLSACNSCSSKSDSQNQTTNQAELSKHQKIVYQPILVSDSLSAKVNEQSGLVYYQDLFWVNNDSDCEAKLYAYNRKGQLKQEVAITNAVNIDWEEVTDDSLYLYVGDFGNNLGERKDLRVLCVKKEDIKKEAFTEVKADFISIEWADQKDFGLGWKNHNFDCEAFFAYGDSLYFFTKNWVDLKTRMYVSPKIPGHYKLHVKAEFNVDFMVTGADISSDGKIMALVGYKNYLTYSVLFSDYKGTDFFEGKATRIDLSPLGGAQTEGIVFAENDSLYLSSEETRQAQSLYKMEWRQWFPNTK
ncbi:hypothetical protein [Labilibaculum sp.]|uniref:hypothetical protein n=1 Tax=Labilibaculum sp. TaxID=2060723 RepID=UPI003566D1DE